MVARASKCFNPAMLFLARQARGYSQSDLARTMGFRQNRISRFESGDQDPTDTELAELSTILDFPVAFFEQTESLSGFGIAEPYSYAYFRKRQNLSAREIAQVNAQAEIRRLHISKLLTISRTKSTAMRRLPIGLRGVSPEDIARKVRATWGIPSGPIDNVVSLLESKGCIIVPCNFGVPEIDALSRWLPDWPPVVFITLGFPPDRVRFTLCHELGHLIMHNVPNPDMEDQANRFAAEFLMPADDIEPELHGVSLPVLAWLKRRWRVSMAALLYRARELGTVSDRSCRHLWMRMSQHGFRKREPQELDPPVEEPRILKKMVKAFLEDGSHSEQDLQKMLCLNDSEFRSLYLTA